MPYNINKIASKCLEKCELPFPDKRDITPVYKNDKEYQSSFKEVKKFSKLIKLKHKKEINCIIFNKLNADGIVSAYIVIRYLKKVLKRDLKEDDINLVSVGPSSGTDVDRNLKYNEKKIKGKNVIVLDLAYNVNSLNYLKQISKTLIVVDDHPITKNLIKNSKLNKKEYYIGDDKHSACAYTWKLFYPKKKVIPFVQLIDSDDRKLFLKHLGNTLPFRTYLNYRIIHNPYLKWHVIESFNKLDDMVKDTNINLLKFIGHYYDEVLNNIKEQIAKNAVFGYFEGHPVYILCFNDPALYKMVLRQMVSNAKKANKKIDFAVTWGWEHSRGEYNVQLSEDHGLPLPGNKLPEIARKLGKIGGTRDGGGGSGHVGHFYWPKGNGKDIWDLFGKSAKYL